MVEIPAKSPPLVKKATRHTVCLEVQVARPLGGSSIRSNRVVEYKNRNDSCPPGAYRWRGRAQISR